MKQAKLLAAAATAAILSMGSWSAANEAAPRESVDALFLASASTQPAVASGGAAVAAPSPSRKPLMALMGSAADPLEKAGITIGGHVEASYTYNFGHSTPAGSAGEVNNLRLFDFEHDEPQLNQLDLTIARRIAPSKDKWDVGFRVEGIYGSDSRFLQANGLNFYGSGVQFLTPTTNYQPDPENQFALYQAYVDINVPVGDGLLVRVGKFASFFGSTVDPTQNSLYSHTLAFGFFRPLTNTGVMGSYQIGDNLTVEAGIGRGWDQALEDNNAAIDVFARVLYKIDDRTRLVVAGITGPESTDDNENYWTVVEGTLQYLASDKLRFALDATFGQIDGAPITVITGFNSGIPIFGVELNDVRYYGLAGYASYTVDERVTVNSRAEVLHVDDGRFVLADSGETTILSATVGVAVTPFPADATWKFFKLRPEIRLDWATDDVFGSLDTQYQVTFGIDALFQF